MKQTNLLVSVLIVVLIASGWLLAFTQSEEEVSEEYKIAMTQAEAYLEKELYQKAIEQYKIAIAEENKVEDWAKMLDAHRELYKQNEKSYYAYLEDVKLAVSAYGDNEDFLITLTELCLTMEDYETPYKYLKKVKEGGKISEKLEKCYLKTRYGYELDWFVYQGVGSGATTIMPVLLDGTWKYIDESGAVLHQELFEYAGPMGDEKTAVVAYKQKGYLIDTENILQGRFDVVPEEARAFAEGLVAVKANGVYSFYDSIGDKKFGKYEDAGCFQEGIAAVKSKNWYLVNASGKPISENTYEEIVLTPQGEYFLDGVMIAKKDGLYHLYDENEKQIGKFGCKQIGDLTESGWIAFEENGKWGYVNREGKVEVKPTYADARSFSNGLAAVSNGSKWGFVNEEMKIAIDYTFEDVTYFSEKGSCMVETEPDKWQLLEEINW